MADGKEEGWETRNETGATETGTVHVSKITFWGKGSAWCSFYSCGHCVMETFPTCPPIKGPPGQATACMSILYQGPSGRIWEGVEFHIWIYMEHAGRGPRGGKCPEAKETTSVGESEPFGKSPESRGRLCTSQRVGNLRDQTNLARLSRVWEASDVILVTQG